jgi:hypothetical protein
MGFMDERDRHGGQLMSNEEPNDETATTQAIHALLAEASDGEALAADGFDLALIYDLSRCVEILMEDGMDEESAVEYLEFNVLGAYVGPSTPVFAMIYRQPTLTDPTEE